MSTTTGPDGIERWPDGTIKSGGNAFSIGASGATVDVATMADNARKAQNVSRALSRDAAAGRNRGSVPGESSNWAPLRTTTMPDPFVSAGLQPIKERQTMAYGRAKAVNSDWASMKRKGMPATKRED